MDDATRLDKAAAWSGSVTLGLSVIALYVALVLAVFAGFACYMTRISWHEGFSAEAQSGARPDLDGMFYMMRREQALKSQIVTLRAQVRDIDQRMDEAKMALAALDVQKPKLDGERRSLAMGAALMARDILPDLAPDAAGRIDAVLARKEAGWPVLLLDALPGLELKPDLAPDRHDAIEARFGDLSDGLAEIDMRLAELASERDMLQRRFDLLSEERSWPRRQIEALETELREVVAQIPQNSNSRARVGSLDGVLWGIPKSLVTFPTIFLTLIVTIASGGLGAVVSFSRSFFHTERPASTARLLVSVGEGMAASIAIFLFSGAGMLALTQGGGAAGDVELSPFTVAFVAFLSGFMAEDAFASIRTSGKRFFSGKSEAAGTASGQTTRAGTG